MYIVNSEYDSSLNIFVNAFPWLFPGGIGGLYDDKRGTLPIGDWARHLLRYKDGRFLHDKNFTFYVFNMIQRHINNTKGQWFIKSECFFGKEPPSIEDLQSDLKKGNTTFISKLQYYSEGIRGSDGFWRLKTRELEGWINHHLSVGNGPPTFFITLSCAENWWPDLRRLLIDLETIAGNQKEVELLKMEGTEIGFQAMARASKKWPLYVNEFFMKRSKEFLDSVVKEALGIKHYWARVEFAPGRGQIHLHLLAIAKDQAYLKEYFHAKGQYEKDQVISQYARKVLDMTADVEIEDYVDEKYKANRTNSPLLRRYCEIVDKEEDSRCLARDCMMHFCNKFCLKENKNRPEIPRECRAGAGIESKKGECDTPGWERRSTDGVITDYRQIKQLQMKRTHSTRVVQHSKVLLQSWRANCDIKLLTYDSNPYEPNVEEIENVVRYVVSYTSKKNKTHIQEKNIIHDLIIR